MRCHKVAVQCSLSRPNIAHTPRSAAVAITNTLESICTYSMCVSANTNIIYIYTLCACILK